MICAVDTETGGLLAGFHEVIAVAIVPLTETFEPAPVEPFVTKVRPEHPDRLSPGALKVNGESWESLQNAPTRKESIELFFQWFKNTVLNNGFKKISPLAQNWAFDKGFLQFWLDPSNTSPEAFDALFDYRSRDTMHTGMFLIDRSKVKRGELLMKYPSLKSLSAKFGVEQVDAHTALGDALTTAACYKAMVNL